MTCGSISSFPVARLSGGPSEQGCVPSRTVVTYSPTIQYSGCNTPCVPSCVLWWFLLRCYGSMQYRGRNGPCVPGCEPARFRRKLISCSRIRRFFRDQLRTFQRFFGLLRTPPEERLRSCNHLSTMGLQGHNGGPVQFWHSSCITGL
jgi:hypothetical protein